MERNAFEHGETSEDVEGLHILLHDAWVIMTAPKNLDVSSQIEEWRERWVKARGERR